MPFGCVKPVQTVDIGQKRLSAVLQLCDFVYSYVESLQHIACVTAAVVLIVRDEMHNLGIA